MRKTFLVLFLFHSLVLAELINFQEVKYIYALDQELQTKGTIEINEDSIILKYTNSSQVVKYDDSFIHIINNNETQKITHDENIEYALFFSLIKGVFQNNTSLLSNNFTIKKTKDTTTLIPNEYLANAIEKIEYKKPNKILEYLTIFFLNQDTIKIKQLD